MIIEFGIIRGELGVMELGVREFDRNGWMVRVVSWSSSF